MSIYFRYFNFSKSNVNYFYLGKFINNILYGKSLQDDTKHLNISLLSSIEQIRYHCLESNYVGRQIIDEINGLVAVASRPRAVFLNRAFSIGFTVLEKSKLLMFKQWFEKLVPNFEEVHLIASDT